VVCLFVYQDMETSRQIQIKRAGPWSLNSIGYNAGLRKLRISLMSDQSCP